jgi:hypothetical protein
MQSQRGEDGHKAYLEGVEGAFGGAGGLGRHMTRADVIAFLGWTKSDERHALRLAEMDEDAFEEFLEERHKRPRRRESGIGRGSQAAHKKAVDLPTSTAPGFA